MAQKYDPVLDALNWQVGQDKGKLLENLVAIYPWHDLTEASTHNNRGL
ncbi:hypothetical protein [Candidatus Marithrix sp. Canyon 246]|nr:hypothetical protein [Candidatus Marithrix sp. Canyon 246]